VIIEVLAPALMWSPDSKWLMGNSEGSDRGSRWQWRQHRKGRCRSAARDR